MLGASRAIYDGGDQVTIHRREVDHRMYGLCCTPMQDTCRSSRFGMPTRLRMRKSLSLTQKDRLFAIELLSNGIMCCAMTEPVDCKRGTNTNDQQNYNLDHCVRNQTRGGKITFHRGRIVTCSKIYMKSVSLWGSVVHSGGFENCQREMQVNRH